LPGKKQKPPFWFRGERVPFKVQKKFHEFLGSRNSTFDNTMTDQELKNSVVSVIRERIKQPHYRVFLFGSRAKNSAGERSDYDIGIECEAPLPLEVVGGHSLRTERSSRDAENRRGGLWENDRRFSAGGEGESGISL
jgi:hypothetical protein